MTIVVAVSVADGLILASDSATTQSITLTDGHVDTINIWNSANKIFNLRKGLALGAMTWGRANFASISIASHCKNLREILTNGGGTPHADALDPTSYTVEEVAERVRDHFAALYALEPVGVFGMLVGGYGSADEKPSVWEIEISDQGVKLSQPWPSGEEGIFQQGQPEAIARIVDGVSRSLPIALTRLGVDADQADMYADAIRAEIGLPIVHLAMPLAEAIELADFLVDATIKFVRFTPGDAFVGGPVEVAALTRHEGFKWVSRKHYYPANLNPGVEP
ncbi:MAG: hypothetical protein Q7V58_01435 [Actinomycetota bacterium]|nr:hypothetical protein [Actinomycetota bacterium]